jgi:hypothetical protein
MDVMEVVESELLLSHLLSLMSRLLLLLPLTALLRTVLSLLMLTLLSLICPDSVFPLDRTLSRNFMVKPLPLLSTDVWSSSSAAPIR